MAFDFTKAVQSGVRRAGQRLRRRGIIEDPGGERRHLEGEKRDRFFAYGIEQVANLQGRFREHTGRSLDGRVVLDYGCGVGRVAIPLAGSCERVLGMDINPALLDAARRYAAEEGVTNVDWMLTDQLPRISGTYDAVLSFWVFQHIPSREGEEVFAHLIGGLRDGGIGAVHFTVPPRYRARDLARHMDLWYHLMNSYNLSRIGRILAEGGVTSWHAHWHRPQADRPSVTLFFAK